ncbi:MAG: hypothetical protein M1327_01015 [Candidatus Thermoplasmatota archaeon]|nr:hypothetical protein [Candidatus Thermoplasmatota archaeon]
MRLLTVLGIIVLVTASLIPVSDTLQVHQDNTEIKASTLLISNNTTIGVTGYETSYYMNNNITIPVGRVLTLLDLNVYVQIQSGNITDYGSLKIIDTSIHMFSTNQSLDAEIHGSGKAMAKFTMENSAWSIPGIIDMSNSIDRLSNDSVSSAYPDPSNLAEVLSIGIANSSFIAYNSTFSGLLHTEPVNLIDAGNLVYSMDVPFSTDNSVPLSGLEFTTKDPIITRITANLTFSGNNPTGENTLNFSYAGNFMSLRLGNTGSVHNTSSEMIHLALSAPMSDLAQLIKSFTVSMHVANVAGSNSSIEALNISLLSNDTVSFAGIRYFSYDVYNSSAVFANSSIDVDMNSPYLYDNVMNPEHDFIYAVNSTIYVPASRMAGIPGNGQFYLDNNSSLLFFAHVRVNSSTGSYIDSNFPLAISPLTSSSYVSSVNDYVVSALHEVNISEGKVNNQSYYYYLLSGIINGSSEGYTGDYEFTIYNFTYEVALPQYNFSSMNNVNETFHTNLPILTVGLRTHYLTMDSANNLSLNISLVGCISMAMFVEADINLGNGKLLGILMKNETVVAPSINVIAPNVEIPYLNESRLTIIVHLSAKDPTYSGENLTFLFKVSLAQNVMLNTSSSYVWLRDQSQMRLSVNYSLNPGPFDFSVSENATINTLGGEIGSKRIYNVNSANERGTFQMMFNLTSIAENVSIFVSVYNDSLLLINASSTIHLEIIGNSSYFPNSTIDVTETGLPRGTFWSISVGNESYSSIQSMLVIYVPNGFYNYSINQIPGYISNQLNGRIAAIYKEEYLNITFSSFKYSILIEEAGLASNHTWSVLIDNKIIYVNGSHTTIYLPNGTYNFSVSSSGFESQNRSYTIFVTGPGESVHVVFVPIKHYSFLSSIFKQIYNSPLSYMGAFVFAIVYLRFYRGSLRICSTCLTPIPKGRMKCQNCGIREK